MNLHSDKLRREGPTERERSKKITVIKSSYDLNVIMQKILAVSAKGNDRIIHPSRFQTDIAMDCLAVSTKFYPPFIQIEANFDHITRAQELLFP